MTTTLPVEEFVQQLIHEAIFKTRASSSKSRGRKQPVFITCEVVVDNAIMPSCSLREKTRSCPSNQERTTVVGSCSFLRRDIPNDGPVALPSRSTTTETSLLSSSSSSLPLFNHEKSSALEDDRDNMSSPEITTSPWNQYSSLNCFVDRSPQSVLSPPGGANTYPPISPRSARWTSSGFTPPRTFLKTKSGLKRLDIDSPLACPQRTMLLSPGGESSSY